MIAATVPTTCCLQLTPNIEQSLTRDVCRMYRMCRMRRVDPAFWCHVGRDVLKLATALSTLSVESNSDADMEPEDDLENLVLTQRPPTDKKARA